MCSAITAAICELTSRPARPSSFRLHATFCVNSLAASASGLGYSIAKRRKRSIRWRPSSARGVLVWCSCNRWGYAGPDESKALDAFRTHVEEETRTGPGEQAGGAE